MLPKSRANAITGQLLLIARYLVSEVLASVPFEKKARRHVTSGQVCHVNATPAVCIVKLC